MAEGGGVVKERSFIPTKFLTLRCSPLVYLLNHNVVPVSSSKNVICVVIVILWIRLRMAWEMLLVFLWPPLL